MHLVLQPFCSLARIASKNLTITNDWGGPLGRPLLLLFLFLWSCHVLAQREGNETWQQVYEQFITIDEQEETEEQLYNSYELLEQLAGEPLDLNKATREDLEQLPFLSAQQVMDIQEYLYRYGPMRSLGELRMIRSLDYQQIKLLPYFVIVTGEDESSPTSYSSPRFIKNTLSATLRIPFYKRKGDRNGYLGYPLRHTLRYELTVGKQWRIGLVGAQDAGEPFFANSNRWGYDVYSYYAQLKNTGRIANLVVGKYHVSAGMGLALGQSFQLGKLATLQNNGRSVSTLKPHTSRSVADYLQGAAATVTLLRGSDRMANVPELSLTAFASYRPLDATLNSDSEAQTIVTSGYHRTPTEMAKKDNTHQTTAGAHLSFHCGAVKLGATTVYTQLDRSLEPQRETLYRRHFAHGQHFLNTSVDYAYTHHRFAFSGETAIDAHSHLATVNTASLRATDRLTLMLLQRFYSYRYTTLLGHSFGQGGSRVQNESGVYFGATWNPIRHLQLQGYADYAHHPWAQYQVSATSDDIDLLLQATWRQSYWTLTARHQSRLRKKDNEEKSLLIHNDDHRQRLAVTWQNGPWALKTQADMTHHIGKNTEGGWLVSQQASYGGSWLTLSTMAAYFNTDSYQSRIYAYERQLQHEISFPTYYGEGIRLALMARTDVTPQLSLSARLGYTNYFDRPTIGTGLQQIPHSYQTDLDLQVRWKF